MGFQIEDGKGTGQQVGVKDNRLNASSRTSIRGYYISRDDGEAYSWTSVDAAAAAGDYILYLQNTSTTKNLYVYLIKTGAANSALWKLWFVTGTASGSSALTGVNMNKTSNKTASATSRGDGAVASLTTDGLISSFRTLAATSGQEVFDGVLILGTNDAIALEYDTGTGGAAEVFVGGFYE